MHYQKLNNLIGWAVFIIASLVYILTVEPTASFWDCGEYIATAYKLQVGHPPGAPLFQMIGRFFSLFAFGDLSKVALMVNLMSALASSFSVLFLFWIITYFAKKIITNYYKSSIGTAEKIMIFGSGAVGALAFTFTDSFWFSAVEGEVYALSSFFTAIVFWAITKWENNAEDPHSFRWLILIAYLIGLSIGVHLLNLLAIPAITIIYYYKKYKPTPRGLTIALGISIVLLALVMYAIIPGLVKYAGIFERGFVNSLGLPFNSGTIFYFVLLISLIVFGLHYTRRHKKVIANTVILAFTFLLIGYSSFTMLVIRSNANTPIDENNPESALSLLAYLNREQYGDWPIFYGRYFNAPRAQAEDGTPKYEKYYLVMDGQRVLTRFQDKDKASDYIEEEGKNYSLKRKYVMTDDAKGTIPAYHDDFKTFFPRMWSNSQPQHAQAYRDWSGFNGNNGIPVAYEDFQGKEQVKHKPKFFAHNLRYFFSYQIGHMYFRYFMWNFAGRQNDIQGHGGPLNGNWISGIPLIDNMRSRVAPTKDMPVHMAMNKAHNKFYMLPFILGLIGLIFQYRVDKRNNFVVFLMFIMTGLAIIVYLNQYPYQPRERDYAYAASLFAFAIWIGLGVMSLAKTLSKYLPKVLSSVLVTILALLLVPGIMASEGWDDHDRSGRYTGLAMAKNYLNSCAPNAILFTNGDNDTFPLWYAQEVEEIRTDVRVVNLSLLNTGWYADQMARKAYKSEPVPFSMTHEQYRDGTRDILPVYPTGNKNRHYDLKEVMRIVASDKKDHKIRLNDGRYVNYFPSKKVKLKVDSLAIAENNVVRPEDRDKILDEIKWNLQGNQIMKNQMLQLDMLAHNNWERPVYFAITTGSDAYINLEKYFQVEGLAYRLVPIETDKGARGEIGQVATDIMYDNMMNEFEWGNMNDKDVFLDYTNRRMVGNLRSNFGRLANALIDEDENEKAEKVCDRCLEVIPDYKIPYDYFMISVVEAYYRLGEMEKGDEVTQRMLEISSHDLAYYQNLKREQKQRITRQIQEGLQTNALLAQLLKRFKDSDNDLLKEAEDYYRSYEELYLQYTEEGKRRYQQMQQQQLQRQQMQQQQQQQQQQQPQQQQQMQNLIEQGN
ncbi:MAG: protein O-mannosyl-transferase family [Bacteroidota bacterium]